ncbi:glycosyltransferase family 4 protein [candidate division TA06 bacterium]|nr:glycosyltransferase family 4 protein [candidate division TA06 bacterium]
MLAETEIFREIIAHRQPFWDIAHITNYRDLPVRAKARVVTVYDLLFDILPDTFPKGVVSRYRSALRSSITRADHFIAISQATKNDLQEIYRVPERKITIIHPGLDPEFTLPFAGRDQEIQMAKKKYGIDRPYIIYLGTIEDRKNIVRLIRAFGLMRKKKGIEHLLVLAGKDGFGAELVDREIIALDLGQAVKKTGYIAGPDKRSLLAGADIFVLPSHNEGFGLPVIEAMSTGTPVAVSGIGVFREVAGPAGVFFDPLDPEEMSEKMFSVLSDKNLRDQIIDHGLKRVAGYDYRLAAAAHRAVYRALL